MAHEIPVRCFAVSAVIMVEGAEKPEVLLLKRACSYLPGEWCHVAGCIEEGESASTAILREIVEESGLKVSRLFSADYCEQFYEPDKDGISVVPVFVAYVFPDQEVVLNEENSEYRWVSFEKAKEMVPFGGQRSLYDFVYQEFVLKTPSRWLKIKT
ncbi:NUDIX pyrophosphatase [Candidatus Riflebacteria bacterium]